MNLGDHSLWDWQSRKLSADGLNGLLPMYNKPGSIFQKSYLAFLAQVFGAVLILSKHRYSEPSL